MSRFKYHNCPPELGDPPSPLPEKFTLTAPPGCDIWKKPGGHSTFDGPICYRTLRLSTFRRARVTVSAQWKTLFDQGGLCLILPRNPLASPEGWKWVKTGIEIYNDSPHVSTVACDRWADWSLVPLEGGKVTIEMEREVLGETRTSTLWVYIVDQMGRRRPLREVTWVFDEDDGDCEVGIYAAKPTKDEDDGERKLTVVFEAVEIESF